MNPLKKKGITMNRFCSLPPVNSFFFFFKCLKRKKRKTKFSFWIYFVCLFTDESTKSTMLSVYRAPFKPNILPTQCLSFSRKRKGKKKEVKSLETKIKVINLSLVLNNFFGLFLNRSCLQKGHRNLSQKLGNVTFDRP